MNINLRDYSSYHQEVDTIMVSAISFITEKFFLKGKATISCKYKEGHVTVCEHFSIDKDYIMHFGEMTTSECVFDMMRDYERLFKFMNVTCNLTEEYLRSEMDKHWTKKQQEQQPDPIEDPLWKADNVTLKAVLGNMGL